MQNVFRSTLKMGILFCLIGIAVSVAIPPLLTAFAGLHLTGTLGMWAGAAATKYGFIAAANVIDTALVFGGFGVLQTLFQPAFNFLFDKKSPQPATKKITPREISGRHMQPTLQQEQNAGVDPAFRQKIDADRAVTQLALQGRNN